MKPHVPERYARGCSERDNIVQHGLVSVMTFRSTASAVAATFQATSVITWLLEKEEIDTEQATNDGDTAFFCAVRCGDMEIVEVLPPSQHAPVHRLGPMGVDGWAASAAGDWCLSMTVGCQLLGDGWSVGRGPCKAGQGRAPQ